MVLQLDPIFVYSCKPAQLESSIVLVDEFRIADQDQWANLSGKPIQGRFPVAVWWCMVAFGKYAVLMEQELGKYNQGTFLFRLWKDILTHSNILDKFSNHVYQTTQKNIDLYRVDHYLAIGISINQTLQYGLKNM